MPVTYQNDEVSVVSSSATISRNSLSVWLGGRFFRRAGAVLSSPMNFSGGSDV